MWINILHIYLLILVYIAASNPQVWILPILTVSDICSDNVLYVLSTSRALLQNMATADISIYLSIYD